MSRFLFLLLSLIPSLCIAQISENIYCINSPALGEFYIAKVNLASGELTNFDLVGQAVSNVQSTCTNEHTSEFYFCSGKVLKRFNALTETMGEEIELPLAPTDYLKEIQYNPCDSSLYGVISNANSTNMSFARFDLGTETFDELIPLSDDFFYCSTCASTAIDPEMQVYVSGHGGLTALDLDTYENVYTAVPTQEANSSFGHMSLKCGTHEIFGTLADTDSQVKRLARVSPYSGVVEPLSEMGWEDGYLKPIYGGSVIDQNTGIFYYAGAGGLLVGASTVTGELVYSDDVSNGELYMIEHFSQCGCPSAVGLGEEHSAQNVPEIYPSPFSTELYIDMLPQETASLTLLDASGRIFLSEVAFSDRIRLDTDRLPAGIYVVQVVDVSGRSTRKKVMKE